MSRVTICALALLLSACGGGGDKTFDREGVSFTYPEAWGEAEYEAVDPAALFGIAFTPEDGRNGLIFEISRNDIAVTESNFEEVLDDVAAGLGDTTEGPTRLTVDGLLALRFVSHPEDDLTREVTVMFDGEQLYALNCGFTSERAEEMKQGCEQVVESFAVE